VERLFEPLVDWRVKAAGPLIGTALPCGHFMPEELPDLVLRELAAFLG
jgi:haloacetate dehalogenase